MSDYPKYNFKLLDPKMSLELIAAGKLLDMALGGIVSDAASEGAKLLWRTIKNR